MLDGKCVFLVLPAYDAANTLEQMIAQVPLGIFDEPLHEQFPKGSSISFGRSVSYGFGILGAALPNWLHRWRLAYGVRTYVVAATQV
jgi:hypothetical protein